MCFRRIYKIFSTKSHKCKGQAGQANWKVEFPCSVPTTATRFHLHFLSTNTQSYLSSTFPYFSGSSPKKASSTSLSYSHDLHPLAHYKILDHASFTPQSWKCLHNTPHSPRCPPYSFPHLIYITPPIHTSGLLQMSASSGRPSATPSHTLLSGSQIVGKHYS